jgi:hypothetical protein
MTAKGYIITFSLTSSAAVAACWLFLGNIGDASETTPAKGEAARKSPARVTARSAPSGTGKSTPSEPIRPPATSNQLPAAQTSSDILRQEELAIRAARIEQEANHDLRRLVKLLDLNEEQQDRVFQTLAEHSPSWNPALQIASASGVATAGKRAESSATIPEINTGKGSYGKKTPAPASETIAAADSAATDPMSEILALLDPGQQDALVKAEMDRAAWWAEILPQITPSDDVPAVIGAPAPGETKAYEGADVLE